jgi:hypothetical protein
MKKNRKKLIFEWTTAIPITILCALCFDRLTLSAADEAPSLSGLQAHLDEARLARDAARLEVTQLRSELGVVQGQLDSVRRQYAELLLKARSQAEALTKLQIEITQLLVGAEGTSDGEYAVKVLDALGQTRRQHAGLYQEVREFGEYLEAVLEVIQPSEVLKREINGRFQRLVREIGRLERMPSLVAGRGGNETRVRRQCRVLAVNDDLQVVVLNAGRNDGVYPGSVWFLARDSVIVGRLSVIESRPAVSAAMPIEGDLHGFVPGAVVRLEKDIRED